MPILPLHGVSGKKQTTPMTTTAVAIVVKPPGEFGGGKFQLVSNSAWLYSSQDEGATADNWLTVLAGATMTLDVVSSDGTTFYAKMPSGSANLHIVEL